MISPRQLSTYVCVHARVCARVHREVVGCSCAWIGGERLCTHTHTHTHTYARAHAHAHTHTHTHTHARTYAFNRLGKIVVGRPQPRNLSAQTDLVRAVAVVLMEEEVVVLRCQA